MKTDATLEIFILMDIGLKYFSLFDTNAREPRREPANLFTVMSYKIDKSI
jgi:hypothetical protein